MPQIHISVRDKVARAARRTPCIVCGNADYEIVFDFDTEWDTHDQKIARFIWNGAYFDEPFTGNVCPVPTVINTAELEVGVYAGELRTTTPATIACRRSVCSDTSLPIRDEAIVEYEHRALAAAVEAKNAASEAKNAANTAQDVTTVATSTVTSALYAKLDAQIAQGKAEQAAKQAEESAAQASNTATQVEALVNQVNTDTEKAREHADQMAEHAATTHVRYVFTVGQEDELSFMTPESCGIYQATNNLRYNDKTLFTIYRYPLTDSTRITGALWHAHLMQQALLQVSTDGKRWITLLDSTGQQINSQRHYELCDTIDLRGAEALYIKISDSAPQDGFGGAISSDIPVTLDLTYGSTSPFALPPVGTDEEGCYLRVIGGRWRTANTINAISHVSQYGFLVGMPSEENYLQPGSNGILNASCRFNDHTAFTLYRYHVANAAFVRRVTWTATVGQHLRIECSSDRENWNTVFDAGSAILPFTRTTYDLTDYLNLWDFDEIYIRISSSYPQDGFGGAISTSDGVYLHVERSEPSVWM